MTTLRDPFAVIHKKELKNKQGVVVAHLDYIGWSQAADRLDEVVPGWSFSVMALGEDWCHGRLTFPDGRWLENVGYAENADMDWKKEALKDAVSDAFKRCAALAGVGRYLYDKDTPRPTTSAAASASSASAAPPSVGTAGRAPVRPAASTVPPEPDWLADGLGEPAGRPETAAAPVCRVHGVPMKPGKKGGHFCSRKNDDGSWCEERAA